MTEPFFFNRGRGLTVREIAALTGAEPQPGADLDRRITGVAALDRAAPHDLAFLDKPKYASQLSASRAGACLTTKRHAGHAPPHVSVLCIAQPYRAFVDVTRKLFPGALRPSSLFEASGVATGAVVHPTARLESGVTVDPGVVIGPRAEIGTGTVINAGAVIGPDVRVGRECAIGANASITNSVIGEGTKIDNLVQIGHNVSIGRHCIIVSQCGISGSVVIEDHVILAGQVGLPDNVRIGEGAIVGAKSGVISDVPAGEKWFGYPALRGREFLRNMTTLRQWVNEDAAARQDDQHGAEDGSGQNAPDDKGRGR